VPLPSSRLASFALKALQVDAELSPLVRRSFSLASQDQSAHFRAGGPTTSEHTTDGLSSEYYNTILRTEYKAKTNRMLRVAVNGFMESLGVVLGVMEELDVDVLSQNRAG